MKYILKIVSYIIFSAVISTHYCNSQEISQYKCAYKFDFLKDTIAMKHFRQEIYILQIGEKITKGFTYQKFYIDSLKTHAPHIYKELFKASVEESFELMRKTGDISHVQNNAFTVGGFTSDLYKDYEKNEIRIKDNISSYSFVFTDELKPQNWEILNDTSTILGYASQKAVCHYRGRDWIAWFTPEIPIGEGPWKFYGLPGLITKIYDAKNHYVFELIGFQKKEEIIDTNIPRTTQKIDRKEFIRAKMGEKGARIVEGDMAQVGLFSNSNSQDKQYDYIELDYKE